MRKKNAITTYRVRILLNIFACLLLLSTLILLSACQPDPIEAAYEKQVELRDVMMQYVDGQVILNDSVADALIASLRDYAKQNAAFWQKNTALMDQIARQDESALDRNWDSKDEKLQEVMNDILRLDAQIRDILSDHPEKLVAYNEAFAAIYTTPASGK